MAYDDLRERYLHEMREALAALPDKRDQATYFSLARTVIMLFEQVQRLDNLPPAVIEIAPTLRDIVRVCEANGWSAALAFESLLAELSKIAEHTNREPPAGQNSAAGS
jgi:hypothetical protein